MKILVTGATGFVGSALIQRLSDDGMTCRAALRRTPDALPENVDRVLVGDLDESTDWSEALRDRDVVVHAAARVHVMQDNAEDPLEAFRKVNLRGSVNLARQAAEAGVKRFVFVSSIKVNGEQTAPGQPFHADDVPAPLDPYGVSKMETEQALFALAEETGMEVVAIRPPLVYGPGVKANFATMMRWLARGVPLPFGRVDNRRSLVALDNLVDLIVTCLVHPGAANQVFLVSDGEDLSTAELLTRLSIAMDSPARLMPIPVAALKVGAWLVGRQPVAQRLLGSLQVDISKTRERLDWVPPVSVDEGFRRTAAAYLAQR